MLYLSKKQKAQLITHSRKEFPNEACGILAGKNNRVKKIYEMANTDNSSQSFFMEPEEQLKVMKEIRESNLEMIGIYHSHPYTQAYPSIHDVRLAFYPEAWHVIISLESKNNPIVRSFKIVAEKISEEKVILE